MVAEFLIRKFVKNSQDVTNKQVRQSYGYLGGIIGIIANILLFIVKLFIGLMINSIAVMADSFNNLSDAASSVITILGFKLSSKPADREHPFGHGRLEYISAMMVSFMVILVGFEFIKSSFERIRNPEALSFDMLTVFVLLLSITVKIWLSSFNKRIGKTIGSKAMEATAWDSLSDVITTSVVVLSLALSRWITFPIDGYIGAAVAVFIMYSGYNLTKESLNPLLGEAPEPELVQQIKNKTLAYDGIIGVHDIIVHNYGPGTGVISLHAELPANIDIMEAHDIIDKAEQEISEELGIHVVMHMDPINTNDEFVNSIQAQIVEVMKQLSEELSLHDFRVVGNDGEKNLIFDLVVPVAYSDKEAKEIVDQLKTNIKRSYNDYNPVIVLDREYSILK